MKTHKLLQEKRVGLFIPLFSMRSEKDWGIGDYASVLPWLELAGSAGFRILQILPINEIQPGENCPYTALSGFALDPVYLAPEAVPELAESPSALELLVSEDFRARLNAARSAGTILYGEIRALKHELLWRVYCDFARNHAGAKTGPGAEFSEFCAANSYWLDDFAMFRLVKDNSGWISWTQWGPLARREPAAMAKVAADDAFRLGFFKYLQWAAQRQWRSVREAAARLDIALFGDLPFMVNRESADVWARQGEFDITSSIGAPPDPLTPEGQAWGLPACRWDEAEKNGFEWWRLRVRRAQELYDIYRLDHMVGFFRTWLVPDGTSPRHGRFDLEGEKAQEARGRRFIRAMTGSSPMLPVGEDLGLIPPYVRKVLADTGVPGYKVTRWEKDWPKGGKHFTDTASYPPVSLATTSTHDTETLASWWEGLKPAERAAYWRMAAGAGKPPPFGEALPKLLENLIGAGSRIVIIPFPDLFGLEDRINTHNTVGPHNWSFRPDTPAELFPARHGAALARLAEAIKKARG